MYTRIAFENYNNNDKQFNRHEFEHFTTKLESQPLPPR